MRLVLILPLLLVAACKVTEDDQNQITVQYNQDVAENTAADVAKAAEEAGEAIANGTEEAVDTARNVDVDVDVDVDTNKADGNSN
jgi:hypothetical protein